MVTVISHARFHEYDEYVGSPHERIPDGVCKDTVMRRALRHGPEAEGRLETRECTDREGAQMGGALRPEEARTSPQRAARQAPRQRERRVDVHGQQLGGDRKLRQGPPQEDDGENRPVKPSIVRESAHASQSSEETRTHGALGGAPECGPGLGGEAHLSATVGTWAALEARGDGIPCALRRGNSVPSGTRRDGYRKNG